LRVEGVGGRLELKREVDTVPDKEKNAFEKKMRLVGKTP
jgi:hypothetical protein